MSPPLHQRADGASRRAGRTLVVSLPAPLVAPESLLHLDPRESAFLWVPPDGDGDFAVALRCAVLRGQQAHLFAGAGIVAESSPRLELAETELKLHTLREALEV